MQAEAAWLVVNRVFLLVEAAFKLVQRLALVETEQQGDERHADRHPIGGLLEIDRAAVGIQGHVELAHARQRMQHAGAGIFGLLEEFPVDLGIGLVLLDPALLLKPGHVDGVDLFVGDRKVEIDLRPGEQRLLVRLVGRHIERIDGGPVRASSPDALSADFFAQPPLHLGGQPPSLDWHRHDVGAKAGQSINE